MPGINGILNVARNALLAQQIGMEVTSQNIANVNTPGYSRQKAVFESLGASTASRIKIGHGVEIDSVIQYVDEYTTKAMNQKTASSSEYDAKAAVLSRLETVFNETTDQNLSKIMDEFWKAWHDLANNPGGMAERTSLINKAEVLARQFNGMSNDLTQIKRNMNSNIKATILELNGIIEGIADLNQKIVAAESSQTTANDLRDQRRVLLEELSTLVENTYLEDDNGSIRVLTSDGFLLVDGNQYYGFEQEDDAIYWNDIQSDVSGRIYGGEMAAWLDLRDEIISERMANLDELAGTLMQQVNALHTVGYTLSGETGKYFFDDFRTAPETPNAGDYSGAAAYIQLSADVLGQPENVAAGGISGDPGDNENARNILTLQTDDTLQIRKWTYEDRGANRSSSLQTGTMDDYYRSLTGELGFLIGDNTQRGSFSRAMLVDLDKIRESVSGVNLDEEMTELIKIQRSYEAAAKLVSVGDEMLQTILQMR